MAMLFKANLRHNVPLEVRPFANILFSFTFIFWGRTLFNSLLFVFVFVFNGGGGAVSFEKSLVTDLTAALCPFF